MYFPLFSIILFNLTPALVPWDDVIKYHKLGWQKQRYYLTILEAKNPKARYWQSHALSEDCREESFLVSFNLRCCQTSLVFLGL